MANLQWTLEADMVALVLFMLVPILVLALLDLAALCWGVDSTDGPYSPEWERRRSWRGYGGTDC